MMAYMAGTQMSPSWRATVRLHSVSACAGAGARMPRLASGRWYCVSTPGHATSACYRLSVAPGQGYHSSPQCDKLLPVDLPLSSASRGGRCASGERRAASGERQAGSLPSPGLHDKWWRPSHSIVSRGSKGCALLSATSTTREQQSQIESSSTPSKLFVGASCARRRKRRRRKRRWRWQRCGAGCPVPVYHDDAAGYVRRCRS
jgi:hypothetical protein